MSNLQEYETEICALQQGLPLSKGFSLRKLSPFVGKDGLLRIKGRLQLSGQPYDAKHPTGVEIRCIVIAQHKCFSPNASDVS